MTVIPVFEMGDSSLIFICDSGLFLALIPLYVALVIALSRHCGKKPYLPTTIFVFSGLATLPIALNLFGLPVGDSLSRSAEEFTAFYTTPGYCE